MNIRDQFDISKEYAYLNTAATSPLPRYVVKEVESFLQSHSRFAEAAWDVWMEKVNIARDRCATLIGAEARQISFLKNTGECINTVCSMLPGRGNAVTTNVEFPSNFLPWRRKYSDLRVADFAGGEVDVSSFERIIDDDTEVVAFSEIAYNTGARMPTREVAEIAHDHGALVVSDAVQALGAVQMNVKNMGIDVLCCGSHKWLTSPFGVGIFYISGEIIDNYEPPYIGWSSLEDDEDFSLQNTTLASSARKFEIGNLNFPGIMGLSKSVEVMLKRGLDTIEDEIIIMSEYMMDALSEMGIKIITPLESHGGIVTSDVANSKEIAKKLLAKRIVVSSRNGLRASTHFWNNKEDIDRFIEAMRR